MRDLRPHLHHVATVVAADNPRMILQTRAADATRARYGPLRLNRSAVERNQAAAVTVFQVQL